MYLKRLIEIVVLVSFLTQTLRRQTLVLLVSVRVDVKSIIKTRQFWCVIIAAYLFSLSWTLPFCLNGTSIAKCLLLAIPGGGLICAAFVSFVVGLQIS